MKVERDGDIAARIVAKRVTEEVKRVADVANFMGSKGVSFFILG